MAYNSRLTRKTQLQRTTKPNKVSSSRAFLNEIYHVINPLFLRRNIKCAAQLSVCSGTATEVHHPGGREGWLLLIISWWVPICRNCHRRITDNSAEAISSGLSMARNTIRGDFKEMAKKDILQFAKNEPSVMKYITAEEK